MKDVYVNGLTGEPYYVSPEHQLDNVKSKNTSANSKSWLTLDKVILLGASIIGSTIGTMIGIMLCSLIR